MIICRSQLPSSCPCLRNNQTTNCLTGWFPDMYLNVHQIEKEKKHSSPCLFIKWTLHRVFTVWVELLPGKITQWLFLQRKVQSSPVHLFPATSKIKREENKLRFKVCHSPSIARGYFHDDVILLQLPQSIPLQWGLKDNPHEKTKPGIVKSTDANVQLASFQTLVKVSLRSVCINKKTTLTKNQPCLNLNAVNVKIHGEIPHVSQCLLCVVIVGCWKKNVSLTNAKVKRATKSCNFFCNIAAKLTAWKTIAHFRVRCDCWIKEVRTHFLQP